VSAMPDRRWQWAAWVLLIVGFLTAVASVRALWRGHDSDPNLFALFLVLGTYIVAGMLLRITRKARLVVIAGGSDSPLAVAKSLIGPYAAGPVVAGPVVPDLLAATRSAQAAAAGLKACTAWQDAPRPVLADDLLPERAMAGDPSAREQLVEEIYRPLEEAGSALLETLSVYLEQASSLEGAARMLFVHPNTVRYRLRRVTDVTGWSPSDVRSAFTLRIALILGRLVDGDLQL